MIRGSIFFLFLFLLFLEMEEDFHEVGSGSEEEKQCTLSFGDWGVGPRGNILKGFVNLEDLRRALKWEQ